MNELQAALTEPSGQDFRLSARTVSPLKCRLQSAMIVIMLRHLGSDAGAVLQGGLGRGTNSLRIA